MSRRLTKKMLGEIKKVYFLDLPRSGCHRLGADGRIYVSNLHVEKLVEEIEACWKEKRKAAENSSGFCPTLCNI